MQRKVRSAGKTHICLRTGEAFGRAKETTAGLEIQTISTQRAYFPSTFTAAE